MIDPFNAFCTGFLAGVTLILFIWAVCDKGKDDWRRNEMTRRGYAEYVVDRGNKLQWRWKEPQ